MVARDESCFFSQENLLKICLCGVIPPCLKLGAALYTECTDGGGEDGDDEINDGFPVYFHILLLF